MIKLTLLYHVLISVSNLTELEISANLLNSYLLQNVILINTVNWIISFIMMFAYVTLLCLISQIDSLLKSDGKYSSWTVLPSSAETSQMCWYMIGLLIYAVVSAMMKFSVWLKRKKWSPQHFSKIVTVIHVVMTLLGK